MWAHFCLFPNPKRMKAHRNRTERTHQTQLISLSPQEVTSVSRATAPIPTINRLLCRNCSALATHLHLSAFAVHSTTASPVPHRRIGRVTLSSLSFSAWSLRELLGCVVIRSLTADTSLGFVRHATAIHHAHTFNNILLPRFLVVDPGVRGVCLSCA